MKFRFLAYLLIFTTQLNAQQRHYILLQTETGTSFTVKMNERTYQSSTAGHIIIPRLVANRYHLELNMNQISGSYYFSCIINEKDLAYTVIDYGVKGWGLRDMYTKEVTMAATNPVKDDAISGSSIFTDILMQVADDTSLNTQTEISQIEVQETRSNKVIDNNAVDTNADAEIQQAIDSMTQLQAFEEAVDTIKLEKESVRENNLAIDTLAVTDEIKTVPFSDTVINEDIKPELVEQVSETKQTVDTVIVFDVPATEIFIPADTVKPVLDNPFYKPDNNVEQEVISNKSQDNEILVVEKNTTKQETINQQESSQGSEPIVAVLGALRPGCKDMYPDDGIEKLKRKVVSENTIESMVQVILKATSNKCLTTSQVKSLGGLFLSDEGRYTLYDALYSKVYDYGMYSSLEKQIVDPYYKKRFLSLLR